MRVRAAVLASVAGAVSLAGVTGLAGCSSAKPSAHPPIRSTSPTFRTLPAGTTLPPGTTVPASASADRATAQAINLTAADLPGWSPSSNSNSAGDQAMAGRLAQCAGAADPSSIDVVDVSSDNFDTGNTEVSSDVTMVRSLEDGRSDLRAITGSKMSGCIQQVARPYLETQLPSGTSASAITFTPLAAPAGIPDSFAFRITIQVSSPNQGTVDVNADTIGFLKGRAEVEANDTQTGGNPDPALEARLVNLLFGRAAAQAGTA